MKILAVETSCDETAISIVTAEGDILNSKYIVHSSITLSQAKLHTKYGGVYPTLAKREHSKNLIPIIKEALTKAQMFKKAPTSSLREVKRLKLKAMLWREPELLKQFLEFIPRISKPPIDVIAVTYGPGLEPALWVGINFAKALSLMWNIPVIPVNHMEGHALMALAIRTKEKPEQCFNISKIEFPVLALLVSGGHTELISINHQKNKCHSALTYKIVGETQDDAVGEAFDKVARMLGLPYPGGPEISKIADKWENIPQKTKDETRKILDSYSQNSQGTTFRFPRPMIKTSNFDFSFSGLKTAVLYTIKKIPVISPAIKTLIAKEFEEAVSEVVVSKTLQAVKSTHAKTLLVGGGVAANSRLRDKLRQEIQKIKLNTTLYLPDPDLSTDNAIMIALAGYMRIASMCRQTMKLGSSNTSVRPTPRQEFQAKGNLRISNIIN